MPDVDLLSGLARDESLGTDGPTPPPAGTGVRGWLRSLHDRLGEFLDVRLVGADGAAITTANRLPVDLGGELQIGDVTVTSDSVDSVVNSTDVPLGAGETYEGAWEDVKDFATIAAFLAADVASAVNGVTVEFTDDPAATPVRVKAVSTTFPGGAAHFSFAPQARYYRVRYVNGATAQTYLRTQILLKYNATPITQQALAAPITDANMGAVTKAHLAARESTGMWRSLLANSLGHLSTRLENTADVTGTAGTSPPAISGTGLLGYLRAIYERQASPSTVPDLETIGTVAAAGEVVQMETAGHGAWSVWLGPAASGASQVYFEGSQNGVDYFALNGRRNSLPALNETGSIQQADPVLPNAATHWRGNAAGIRYFRVRLGVRGGTDSIPVIIRASATTGAVFLNSALPGGVNNLGSVSLYDSAEPLPFTGTLTNAVALRTYTPQPGKAVKLLWVQAIADPQAAVSPVLSLTIGGQEFYRGYAIAHRQAKTGPVDGTLVLSMSGAGVLPDVPFTAHVLEV